MTTHESNSKPTGTPVVGIFGGSFDPIHNGHLGIARQLIDAGVLGRVVFMPAAQAPHKLRTAGASPAQRLSMLALAIDGDAHMEVSDYEIERGGISYTIDTALHFKSIYGDGFRLIIGMDSLNDLHKWYRSQELVDQITILTYPRPGVEPPSEPALADRFGPDRARRLMGGIVDGGEYDVSSTQIRDALKSENLAERLMPAAVYDYIKRNGLYGQRPSGHAI